jgi:hypothetical protein
MPRYREFTSQGHAFNPNEWSILRSDNTITVLTVARLIVWQTTDRGQCDQHAIEEAIVASLVESWED